MINNTQRVHVGRINERPFYFDFSMVHFSVLDITIFGFLACDRFVSRYSISGDQRDQQQVDEDQQ